MPPSVENRSPPATHGALSSIRNNASMKNETKGVPSKSTLSSPKTKTSQTRPRIAFGRITRSPPSRRSAVASSPEHHRRAKSETDVPLSTSPLRPPPPPPPPPPSTPPPRTSKRRPPASPRRTSPASGERKAVPSNKTRSPFPSRQRSLPPKNSNEPPASPPSRNREPSGTPKSRATRALGGISPNARRLSSSLSPASTSHKKPPMSPSGTRRVVGKTSVATPERNRTSPTKKKNTSPLSSSEAPPSPSFVAARRLSARRSPLTHSKDDKNNDASIVKTPQVATKKRNNIRRNSPLTSKRSTSLNSPVTLRQNSDDNDRHPHRSSPHITRGRQPIRSFQSSDDEREDSQTQSPHTNDGRQGSPSSSPAPPCSSLLLQKSSVSLLESSDDTGTPRSHTSLTRFSVRRRNSSISRPSLTDSKDNYSFRPAHSRDGSFASVGSDAGENGTDTKLSRRRSPSPRKAIASAAARWRSSLNNNNSDSRTNDGAASAAAAAGETYIKMTDEEIDEFMKKKEELSDPLIDLFDAHNTQRVRFNLAGTTTIVDDVGPNSNHTGEDSDDVNAVLSSASPNDSDGQDGNGTPSSKIKGFMRKVLFGTVKESPDLAIRCDPPTSGSLKKAFGFELTPLHPSSLSPLSPSDTTTKMDRNSPSVLRSRSPSSHEDGANSPLLSISSDGFPEFQEDPKASARASKLISRAKRAQYESFKYEAAIGYYLAALSILGKAGYPDVHPITDDTMKRLNDAHHAQVSLANSANIVKMGIRHENRGEFVRALKMYTIAYRIRRDALGKMHPSLPVILNMLGSVQVKRGELKEAMQLYALALHGRPDDNAEMRRLKKSWELHPNTKSVTLRDMGMIHERWGNEEKSLKLYCESLDCIMQDRPSKKKKDGKLLDSDQNQGHSKRKHTSKYARDQHLAENVDSEDKTGISSNNSAPLMGEVKFIKSHSSKSSLKCTTNSAPVVGIVSPSKFNDAMDGDDMECGEMEVYLNTSFNTLPVTFDTQNGSDEDSSRCYQFDSIFPEEEETDTESNDSATGSNASGHNYYQKKKSTRMGSKKGGLAGSRGGADVNVAMTIHQIAQIYRRRHQYAASLSAYQAALRGMKRALGHQHPNVAAILGNVGNLHKEMGNYDEAYGIYQEVLGIESLHLGLDHPEVSVTLHNIATIESSRGRYDDAITLYRQVLNTQRARFGPNHVCCAVTTSCMGDVYERMGDLKRAMVTYEETLQIRTELLGRQHLDVGRLLHKLGSLALHRGEFRMAETYVLRAMSVYKVNDLEDDHPLMRDIARDEADIQARLAVGDERFEC